MPDQQAGFASKDQLPEKLIFLRDASSYGAPVEELTCIETHMSWVFLIGTRVFKLKKPVRFPFLDFSSLAAREFYCREELRLNARLAPGVYLGLMVLQRIDGQLKLLPEGERYANGETLDWLVLMRRLPSHKMLDQLLAHAAPGQNEIQALVGVLGQFYRRAHLAQMTPEAYRARYSHHQSLAREILLRPQFTLRNAAPAIDQFDRCLAQGADLLGERVLHGRVREGHGDLRPEHVCLLSPPLVIDCLEFNQAMREVDPFDEIAYLSLECEMLENAATLPGHRNTAQSAWIAKALITGLSEALDDWPDPALLHLYRADRAMLRARLSMAHLLDTEPRTPEKWPLLAQRYLDSALTSMQRFNAAMHGDSP